MLRMLRATFLVGIVTCIASAQGAPSAHVTIPVLIQDSHHRPVVGLTRESLAISRHKVPITDFTVLPTGNLPLELGILLDASGSEQDSSLQILFTVARDFAEDALRARADRAFLGTFDIRLKLTPWLDREGLQRAPTQVKAGGGTALYDAIVGACQRMGEPDWNNPTRRVLVVISDGEDNQSHVTLGRAVLEAVRSGTVIFSLDMNRSGLVLRGSKVMEDLATQTGGEVVSISGRKNEPNAFGRISELMRGMYFISYAPTEAGPKMQDIELKSATGEKLFFSLPKSNIGR